MEEVVKPKNNLFKITAKIKSKISKYKFFLKPAIILTIIYLIGFSAILRANFYYSDDLGRADLGYKKWDDFSRYLSNFLSNFIHTSPYLTDISPLTQIVASFLLAFSGVMLLHIITGKERFSIIELIATIPLGLSPYFLECITYKYDSPYMAFSIFISIFPLLFHKDNRIKYFVISTISMICLCSTYQAASGIFPMLVILICLLKWNKQENMKEIFIFFTISILGYVLGLGIFKVFIMAPVSNYVSNSLPAFNRIIPNTIGNLIHYFRSLKNDFRDIWLIFVFIICACFIFVSTVNTKQKKIYTLLISVATLLIMLILSFGVYPLLEEPLFENARAMYGFGAFLAFIITYIVTFSTKWLPKIFCLILCWMFFVFSFTYGNALYVQQKYEEYRMSLVIEELNDLGYLDSERNPIVIVRGSVGYAPSIRHMPISYYNIISKLIPVNFSGNYWGVYKFFNYYDLNNFMKDALCNAEYDENMQILKDTIYYTIRGNDDWVIIELKPESRY